MLNLINFLILYLSFYFTGNVLVRHAILKILLHESKSSGGQLEQILPNLLKLYNSLQKSKARPPDPNRIKIMRF